MKNISESYKKARVFTSKGEDSALNAMKMAIDSLGDEIKGAKGVIIHYAINDKYPLSWIGSANEILQERLGENVLYKFGWSWDNSLESTQVEVMLMSIDNCDEAGFALESLIKSRES